MVKCKTYQSFKDGTVGIGFCYKKTRARSWNDSTCQDYRRRAPKSKPEVKLRTLDGSEVKEEDALRTLRERRNWKTGNKEEVS